MASPRALIPRQCLRTLKPRIPRPYRADITLYPSAPSPRYLSTTSPLVNTIDKTEVSHFSALASSWWDPHGPSRLLHLMNPLRHTFINSCLRATNTPPPTNLQILDIGSGGGIFAESAARLPNVKSVTGIDPTPEVFKVAELHKRRDPKLLEEGRLRYLNIGIEDLENSPEVPAEGYDIVTIFEVLEHVSSPSEFLTRAAKHLKPGGWLIMSTISRTWTSWMVTKVMAEDVLGIVPRGTHDWDKYVNEYELREWFAKRKGWESPRSMGVMYVPGIGWREITGGENLGNYFFGVRKSC
ncbi:hypothetical protein EG328_005762 [Venturia inaequalis]|uniref:Ubiquinone biosynthesis O-methyltransferase, mitochondrial n=1 Tax=Venturia inaequalis TaxID=5025 RepID=A0A8H3ZF30_VENIN|nr:hypothetical protein EG328_005762 [Venturia inaequalis]KAE9993893.1 hypothetical protein EG327_002516 [Venturia inaequalis]RDI79011.1 Sorting nexin-41 [Venturia inaequalis]